MNNNVKFFSTFGNKTLFLALLKGKLLTENTSIYLIAIYSIYLR